MRDIELPAQNIVFKLSVLPGYHRLFEDIDRDEAFMPLIEVFEYQIELFLCRVYAVLQHEFGEVGGHQYPFRKLIESGECCLHLEVGVPAEVLPQRLQELLRLIDFEEVFDESFEGLLAEHKFISI